MATEFRRLKAKRYPEVVSKPKGDSEYWKKFSVSLSWYLH